MKARVVLPWQALYKAVKKWAGSEPAGATAAENGSREVPVHFFDMPFFDPASNLHSL